MEDSVRELDSAVVERTSRGTRPHWNWFVLVVALTIASGAFVFADDKSPVRAVLSSLFLLVCPGLPYVRFLRLREGVAELALGIALSIALDGLASGVMLYAGVWSAKFIHALLIYITGVGLVLNLMRPYLLPPIAQPSPEPNWAAIVATVSLILLGCIGISMLSQTLAPRDRRVAPPIPQIDLANPGLGSISNSEAGTASAPSGTVAGSQVSVLDFFRELIALAVMGSSESGELAGLPETSVSAGPAIPTATPTPAFANATAVLNLGQALTETATAQVQTRVSNQPKATVVQTRVSLGQPTVCPTSSLTLTGTPSPAATSTAVLATGTPGCFSTPTLTATLRPSLPTNTPVSPAPTRVRATATSPSATTGANPPTRSATPTASRVSPTSTRLAPTPTDTVVSPTSTRVNPTATQTPIGGLQTNSSWSILDLRERFVTRGYSLGLSNS